MAGFGTLSTCPTIVRMRELHRGIAPAIHDQRTVREREAAAKIVPCRRSVPPIFVTSVVTLTSLLVDRNICTAAGLVGLEQERAEQHQSGEPRQQPEYIHVGERCGLSLDQT